MDDQSSQNTLVLLRHAKTERGEGKSDSERELTERGHRDAGAVGAWLHEQARSHGIPAVDVVICSTSIRTRQTWDLARAAGVEAGEVRYERAVYNARAETLLGLLQDEADDDVASVLMVGHAPGVPDLATLLAGPRSANDAVSQLSQGLGTAGIAVLRFRGPWRGLEAGTAELVELVVPRG